MKLFTLLARIQAVVSNNEARRLVYQKGIKINGELIMGQDEVNPEISVNSGDVVQVGRKSFTLSQEQVKND